MNFELLKQGCFIMIIGMGFVYFFICIMIWVMEIVAKCIKLINKYFPEQIEEETQQSKKKAATNDAEIALAIACAFAKRRKGNEVKC